MTIDVCSVRWSGNGSGRYNDYYQVRWRGATGKCSSFDEFTVAIRTPTANINYPVMIGSVVKSDFTYQGIHYNRDGTKYIDPIVITIPTIVPPIETPVNLPYADGVPSSDTYIPVADIGTYLPESRPTPQIVTEPNPITTKSPSIESNPTNAPKSNLAWVMISVIAVIGILVYTATRR